jgi:sulfatase maturation enzyme AslB (radical SAM superfamily)
MEQEIPTIERLYIVGGEPLLIDQHYEFLQKCIDAGRSKSIVIEYNTNITNIPERAWNIWKHFERIQIGMSVDAVGPINDYIRNPSKWHKI